MFKIITLLKQNAHDNAAYEINTYPVAQEKSLRLLDEAVSLISKVLVDRHNLDVETKERFEALYGEVSSRLAQAFDTIDDLNAQKESQAPAIAPSSNLDRQMQKEREAAAVRDLERQLQKQKEEAAVREAVHQDEMGRLKQELNNLQNKFQGSSKVLQRQQDVTQEILVRRRYLCDQPDSSCPCIDV